MKKILALIMAAMLAACTLISCSDKEENAADTPEKEEVTAENENKEAPEAENNEDTVETEEAEEVEEVEEVENDSETETEEPEKLEPGQYASVEEFVEANPSIMDSVAAAYGDSVNLELRADGNKLIYSMSAQAIDSVFLYAGEVDEEQTKSYFDPVIDRMANSMGQAVIAMRREVPSLESIVIEYTFTDGTLIYSREITEEDATKDYGETNVDILDVKSMTVEEWAENLGAQSQSTDYYTMNVEARGNSLAYVYTLNEMFTEQDIDLDAVSVAVEDMRGAMEELVSMIRTNCPQLESVIYEYALHDGTVVYSCDFH